MSRHAKTRTHSPRAVTIALAAAVVCAVASVLVDAPTPLRALVAFPVLVLVAGHSAGTLVSGRRAVPTELRAALPVLLGMVVLLAVVLLIAVLGVPIAAGGVAIGAGAAALALLVIARWRTLVTRTAEPPAWTVGAVARRWGGPVAAVLVLSAATAVAVALRPVPVERYTQLALDEPAVIAGEPWSAPARSPVTLRWTQRGYGAGLPDAAPDVRVEVAGRPAVDVRADVGSVLPGPPAQRYGAVRFTAPAAAGRYEVRVTVGADTLVVPLAVSS